MVTSRTNALEKVQINKNPGSKEVLQTEAISQVDQFHLKVGGNKTQILSFKFWKIFFFFL